MRIYLASLLAAFLAVSTASPLAAADRPVGPETGQVRTAGPNDASVQDEPDWGGGPQGGFEFPPVPNEHGFIPAPDSCWFWWRCD